MKITYKTNRNICYSCKYHIVWCPKYRKKILVGKVETRLKKVIKEVIKEVCQSTKCELIEIECDKDHVHLLVEIDPQFGVHIPSPVHFSSEPGHTNHSIVLNFNA